MSLAKMTTVPDIQVRQLTKIYTVHEREQGTFAAVKSLFKRRWKPIRAVDGVSFDVPAGQIVGFLGPNGAGKTTTIKMLSGILYPSGGSVQVLGYTPFKREKPFLMQITLAMGRRNQLLWDVPPLESFEFFRAVYNVPPPVYRDMLREMTDLMDLGPLLKKPVRNLSLGERMKCELTAALLHRPKLLLLDEPTIGLDLIAQSNFRNFISQYNRRYGATILLTSHYVGDVEALCSRVMFINEAKLVYDGMIDQLVERSRPYKIVKVTLDRPSIDLSSYGTVVDRNDRQVTLHVPRAELVSVARALTINAPIVDLNVSDPSLTEVIKDMFQLGVTDTSAVVAASAPALQRPA